MPLGTLDRTPPPFFKPGPVGAVQADRSSAALALFLMVADTRFSYLAAAARRRRRPCSTRCSASLLRAGRARRATAATTSSACSARSPTRTRRCSEAGAQSRARQRRSSSCAARTRGCARCSSCGRALAGARARRPRCSTTRATRSRARCHRQGRRRSGIEAGLAGDRRAGVVGQVTRVLSCIGRSDAAHRPDQAIPVLNSAHRRAQRRLRRRPARGGLLELRFMAANADVQVGDLLTTSRRRRRLSAGPAGRQGRQASSARPTPASRASSCAPAARRRRRAPRAGARADRRRSCRRGRRRPRRKRAPRPSKAAAPGRSDGTPRMIMPPRRNDQLLLPVNPLLHLAHACSSRCCSTSCRSGRVPCDARLPRARAGVLERAPAAPRRRRRRLRRSAC